jgi:hypothetical protein
VAGLLDTRSQTDHDLPGGTQARRQYCKILRKFEHEWPLDMIAEIQYWRHASVMRFNQGHQRPQMVNTETPSPHLAVTAASPRKAPRAR